MADEVVQINVRVPARHIKRIERAKGLAGPTAVIREALRAKLAVLDERERRTTLLKERLAVRGIQAKPTWDEVRGAAMAQVGGDVFVDSPDPWIYRESFRETATRLLTVIEPGSQIAQEPDSTLPPIAREET